MSEDDYSKPLIKLEFFSEWNKGIYLLGIKKNLNYTTVLAELLPLKICINLEEIKEKTRLSKKKANSRVQKNLLVPFITLFMIFHKYALKKFK